MYGFCLADLKAALSCAAFLFLLTGCGGSAALRQKTLALAQGGGLLVQEIAPRQFPLLVLGRLGDKPVTTISIYIEGDGAPWPSPYHPPRDPTPTSATVLNMAMMDPEPNTVYLGRPCQYLGVQALANCDPSYRDEGRFAPEVIAEYDHILDTLKRQTGALKLHITGYSGGGVVAALLAAHRTDVARWTTVAAPLDLEAWTNHQGISPMTKSMDPGRLPMDTLPPGFHWAGGEDRVVPLTVSQSFIERHGGTLRVMPNFDHVCCWAQQWAHLLKDASQ
ncbi:hypothetical protein [Denitratisoma oestradiolicum]|uniref:Alpha/beta hydrolase n=1 Tax=Denitratisoma oestradiolicum TaxID=311182 RepID=A0A6S6XN77_9PROT|nr:hypothetical protein [Denitratisoma oestradiolicum]CAB1367371.1 conserved protein of unknown function [Denitratisoma oestradiolicum]